jgi:type II secretory pathway predicted ATPase ExeA
MYQRFYHLEEMPFELTPDPKYLYLSRQHREALSNLEYGLLAGRGITVLLGEAGTGKTTLLHAMLASHRCRNVNCVFISNPALTRAEFYEMLAQRFSLGGRAGRSKAVLLTELEALLRERRISGFQTALVIDEAQSLSAELLEEIRLLANTETSTQKLLPLVLVGQPELRDRLNTPRLRQLKQRITLRCEITRFTLAETSDYIGSRVRIAGGDATALFTRDAVSLIHERSRGIPRTISVLCDNALLTGCGLGLQPVTRAVVLEVASDFDLPGAVQTSPPADLGTDHQAAQSPSVADRTPGPPEPLLADQVVSVLSDAFRWSVHKARTLYTSAVNPPNPSGPRSLGPSTRGDEPVWHGGSAPRRQI